MLAVVCYMQKTAHNVACGIALKAHFALYPFCTLLCYSFLGKLIAQTDFKIGAIKIALSIQLGNEKLTFFLLAFVFDKCRRCKNEAEFLYAFQFLL